MNWSTDDIKNVLVKVENINYLENVKQLVTILALTGFLFSSLFGNSDLENLSTIIHIASHQGDASSAQKEDHHDDSEHHHSHTAQNQKTKSKASLRITHHHKESSNSEPKNNEPHEHSLTISPNFVAFVFDNGSFDYSETEHIEPLSLEPNQLISGLYKDPLFRPPIS